MEAKLDELLSSIKDLKETQTSNQKEMSDKIAANQLEMMEKMNKLERDVYAGQDDAADRVVKRLKREKGLEFKKKGHEIQYLFNEGLGDKMESASAALAKVNATGASDKTALDQAKAELQEGMQAITQCQKLIRLADRSEFGWDAVNEYEKDELADNDDDARRLEKAEKAAEQKALKKRRAAPRGGNRNKARRPSISSSGQQYSQPPMGAAQTMLTGGFSQPRGANYRPPKTPGPCFHCLKMGHLKANCPELKSYPFLVSDMLTSSSSSSSSSTSSENACSSSGRISSVTGNLTKGSNNLSSASSMLTHVSSCSSIDSVKHEASILEGSNVEVPKPGLHHTGDSNLQSCEIPKVPLSSVAISSQLTSCSNCPSTGTPDSLECDIYDIYQPLGEDPYEAQVCAMRFWEREQGPMQDKNVQGRLKQNYNFWKDVLKASQPVLELLAEG